MRDLHRTLTRNRLVTWLYYIVCLASSMLYIAIELAIGICNAASYWCKWV